ncbi:MAG: hypothetical protein BAJALOKI1v1_1630012 [Promethearchaeota archaeon]|nr:MAG: hypothetical protein BAJALOKI1v1_1630012 [Candidatus Lokiarchaeota archaeon]
MVFGFFCSKKNRPQFISTLKGGDELRGHDKELLESKEKKERKG